MMLQELNDDFWLPGHYESSQRLSLRKEIDFRTPSGDVRYLGISISPLRSRDSERDGYVFQLSGPHRSRRLEQEVATKERMAALGRLSAAIAHEIRQPLSAMAVQSRNWPVSCLSRRTKKHLVNIVSRNPNGSTTSSLIFLTITGEDLRISPS